MSLPKKSFAFGCSLSLENHHGFAYKIRVDYGKMSFLPRKEIIFS
jgi:hypothetical protein